MTGFLNLIRKIGLLNQISGIKYRIFVPALVVSSIIDLFGLFAIYRYFDFYSQKVMIDGDIVFDFGSVKLSLVQLTVMAGFVTLVAALSRVINTYIINLIPNLSRERITRHIMRANLYESYNEFLLRNIEDEIKDALSEVDQLVERVSLPFFILINYGTQFVLLFSFLMYASVKVTLFASIVFLFFYYAVGRMSRKKIRQIGEVRNSGTIDRARYISDSLRGRKVLQSYNMRKRYADLIDAESEQIRKANVTFALLTQSPKFLVEMIATILILFLLYLKTSNGFSEESISKEMGTIVLFAMSAYRLLPVLQGLYQNIFNLRYGSPILDRVLNKRSFLPDLESENETREAAKVWTIKLENVSLVLGETKVLHNINLTVSSGNRIVVEGESGSGKTTLIDLISGLLEPTNGDVHYLLSPGEYLRIAYVAQAPIFFNGTLEENLTLSRCTLSRDWLIAALCRLGLSENEKHALALLSRRITSSNPGFSGGQAQRLMIIRALFTQPSLLVLDEATSALDNQNKNSVLKFIDEQITGAVLFITHDEKLMTYYPSKIKVKDGTVVQF